MTTCKQICIVHHSNTDFHFQSVPIPRIIIYIQSKCRFINAHPLCAKRTFINQHLSSLIIYPHHTHHTWRPQYVIAPLHAVSSASFLSSPSNFLPLQVFMGLYRKFQPTDFAHLYFLHTFCCSSIYLTKEFLTCMFYLFE